MALKVEIIAKQTIKPSSPTPSYLKTFKLSLIDQIFPTTHIPLVLFYSAKNVVENEKGLDHLMRSLSKVLTQYYQLGGRIKGHDFINCNDEGIDFFKAQVNVQLSQLLSHPKLDEFMHLLLPITDKLYGLGEKMLLSIQANIFDGGAMALGVCITHTGFDASSVSLFLNNWAAVARGNNDIIQPIFDITPFFPHREGIEAIAIPLEAKKLITKVITKRFVFDECNIDALKEKCSSSYIENPSRVESIIALLWMCAMNVVSLRKKGVKPTKSVANIAVNLRGRMIPPLSNNYVGNLMTTTMAISTTERNPNFLQILVGQIRKAITKFDNNFMEMFQIGDGVVEHMHSGIEHLLFEAEVEGYTFSSWCRFPFQEIDFGWGEPTWACPLFNMKNMIVLVDTKCGKGVEASVSLVEEDMDSFEREPELIAFTSATPKF